jgi:transcriptional regulator of aromatic amino acid metabolism
LASAAAAADTISIREVSKGEIVLDGVTEMSISTTQDVERLLEKGNTVRVTAAHK